MILLDTDILSLILAENPTVVARLRRADDDVAVSVITKVDILRGRFDFLLKASNGEQLRRAQAWLERTEVQLQGWHVVGVDAAAVDEFDQLRQNKALRKIGRADLLVASIALAHRARLVTRNLRDFRPISGLSLENWASQRPIS